MPPRAIFFDMDDTLLDTSGGMEVSWELSCQHFGPLLGCEPARLRESIRREANEFWRDESIAGPWRVKLVDARVEVIRRALVAEGLDPAQARALGDHYGGEITGRIRLFDDALETLEWLRGRGYRLALITNGPADMQHGKIERFALARHFDAMVVEGAFGRGKPEREVFDHALQVTGTAPSDAWHIGDNLYADIGGARNAGLHAVWIHRDRLELPAEPGHAPDRVIGHLAELRTALEEGQGSAEASA